MSAEIAALDAALAMVGENVVLRRITGTTSQTNTDVTCRAKVVNRSPIDLIGSITQDDTTVIISPTQINAAVWPVYDPNYTSLHKGDQRIPRKDDKIIAQNRTLNVLGATPFYVNGELVRIEIKVKG